MASALIRVPSETAEKFWPFVETMLAAAVARCGDWTLPDLRERLLRGDLLLWITTDDGASIQAAAVTGLFKKHYGLVCQAIACGGTDENWAERFAAIEDYAKDEGCVACRIQGRQGWARIFRDYKIEWVSLEKRLD